MDLGLRTGLDTRHVISHRVHASLSRVDFDDRCQLMLAALQLLFPVDTEGFAEFEDHRLRVRATV